MAICILIAGRCLSRRKGDSFALVMACIECLFVPFGTILGAFTIVALSRESVRELFPTASMQPPSQNWTLGFSDAQLLSETLAVRLNFQCWGCPCFASAAAIAQHCLSLRSRHRHLKRRCRQLPPNDHPCGSPFPPGSRPCVFLTFALCLLVRLASVSDRS